MCSAPGTARLFLAEQSGQIYSFATGREATQPDLFFSLSKSIPGATTLYGITFHPSFQTNGYVYLCYVLKDGLPDGSRVSRFSVVPTDPPSIDPKSEQIVITWLSGGHNGGCIKFGADGNLYVSTGDGAGPDPPDPLATGQDNRDLLSCILRIDVDRLEPGKAYRVPEDNPFRNIPEARPEIWAYGLRNPWRMSFDRQTGELWVGDVGWELWEMVYRIERGGNYGWSIVEGPQSVHPDAKRGPTPILPPVKSHPHSEAASITGGYVYRGTKQKELVGAYVYGDWVTGKIWALRSENGKMTSLQELVDTPYQIVCFCEDNAGELFVVDYGGGIYELVPNAAPSSQLSFPRKLSETGLFQSVKDHILAPGVIPFEINTEMWADHAHAFRFAGLPDHTSIQTGATNVWVYQSKNEWRYPTNAVLAKTLSAEMEHGRPETLRRLETQILHYDGLDWHAYSYRWNEAQSDAALVAADGDEATLDIRDAGAPGGRRQQTWRFHSRTECLRCHNPWVNFALAFTAPQLNRNLAHRSGEANGESALSHAIAGANQLRALSDMSVFDQPLDERARPRLTSPYDTSADLAERARSWLHVNCSHCHREGAGGSVVSHFDYDTKLSEMKALGRPPSQGTLGLTNAHVITPGDPCASVLYYRVATTGQGRMPLIGSRSVDVAGMRLLHDWIEQLSPELAEQRTTAEPLSQRQEISSAVRVLWNPSASKDELGAALDCLLASPSSALAFLSAVNERNEVFPCPPPALDKIAQSPLFQVHDLFERFLPDELRPKKLGLNIKPDELLQVKGDAARGRNLFFRENVQCSRCHRIEDQGRDFGPELSHIGKKYSRGQVLDQILNPSKSIDPAFVTYQVETKDDLSYSGFLVSRTSNELSLKTADLSLIRLPAAQVKTVQPSKISAMPEGLLQSLTAQNAADLLEFLSSLR
jgi:putative heme-binding domain-containing protein